jgi:hypothetical protein
VKSDEVELTYDAHFVETIEFKSVCFMKANEFQTGKNVANAALACACKSVKAV